MSKNNDGEDLEYYKAKQNAGQLPVSKNETTKTSKSLSNAAMLKLKSDGYIPMNESPEKQREFERYKEITFAQKASEKAKQNPLIPIGLLTTVAALTLGLRAVSRGDKWQSQMMMRARIGKRQSNDGVTFCRLLSRGKERTFKGLAIANTYHPL
ncbi:unnamed protein product [Rotaria sp. Silwood1]|nr:unnamed protein product [Rotaria sp. Silwood1]CAF1131463.1 unnamed protein product [Rotaria sp. Silwood1]